MRTDLKSMIKAASRTVSDRLTEATSFLQHVFANQRDGSGVRKPVDGTSTDRQSPPRLSPDSNPSLRAVHALLPKSVREMLDSASALRFDVPGEGRYAPAPGDSVPPTGRGQFLAANFSN
ncbi:MAG: hypothetical protein JOY71_09885, partial [Acetobacteraceae bacterium]|nr:hypothetical protein [Acetobacteraceae bacterium]